MRYRMKLSNGCSLLPEALLDGAQEPNRSKVDAGRWAGWGWAGQERTGKVMNDHV